MKITASHYSNGLRLFQAAVRKPNLMLRQKSRQWVHWQYIWKNVFAAVKISLANPFLILDALACPGVPENHPAGWCAHSLGGLQYRPCAVGSPVLLAGADDAGDRCPRTGSQVLAVIRYFVSCCSGEMITPIVRSFRSGAG